MPVQPCCSRAGRDAVLARAAGRSALQDVSLGFLGGKWSPAPCICGQGFTSVRLHVCPWLRLWPWGALGFKSRLCCQTVGRCGLVLMLSESLHVEGEMECHPSRGRGHSAKNCKRQIPLLTADLHVASSSSPVAGLAQTGGCERGWAVGQQGSSTPTGTAWTGSRSFHMRRGPRLHQRGAPSPGGWAHVRDSGQTPMFAPPQSVFELCQWGQVGLLSVSGALGGAWSGLEPWAAPWAQGQRCSVGRASALLTLSSMWRGCWLVQADSGTHIWIKSFMQDA